MATPLDFDGWAGNDLPEWSYAHCLPYFKKYENYDRGGDDYRGDDGPLHVTVAKPDRALDRAFLEAALQAGYPYSEDNNGYQHEGFGVTDRTIHQGERWSTASAYLRPAMQRDNLDVEADTLTHRILLDGRRAVGVEYSRGGETLEVHADCEVIVCGGAINSPQILLLSGVGDADHLREHGIPVAQHLPGVGRNLQDHLDLRVQVKCKQPVSVYPSTKGLGRLAAGVQWLLTKRGVASSNLFEVAGYIRTNDQVPYPNLQSGFMAAAAHYDGSKTYPGHGYQAHLDLMRPTSRGRVRLASADPRRPPSIVFNYLETESDRQEVIDGLRLTREILAQKAFEPYDDGELSPWHGRAARRGGARLGARHRRHRVSPHQHLHHGHRRRVGSRRCAEGPRAGGPAGRRRLDHAEGGHRQHQLGDDHDRREGRRHHRGKAAPRASLRGEIRAEAPGARQMSPALTVGTSASRPSRPRWRATALSRKENRKWIPARQGSDERAAARLSTVIPAKLVPAKTGNGNPLNTMRYKTLQVRATGACS